MRRGVSTSSPLRIARDRSHSGYNCDTKPRGSGGADSVDRAETTLSVLVPSLLPPLPLPKLLLPLSLPPPPLPLLLLLAAVLLLQLIRA